MLTLIHSYGLTFIEGRLYPQKLPGHQCSILKSSTPVNAILAVKKVLRKNVICKVFTLHSEGLFENCLPPNTMAIICEQKHSWAPILALQQTTSKFQKTLAISTSGQLRFGTDYNFGLASTIICERGFSKQNRVKSDHRS